MPDKNANTPSENMAAKESAVDTAKSAAVSTTPAKVDDGATAKANGAGPSSSPATATTANEPASKSRLKKFVPVIVLALAGVILFTIIGGWNGWIGSSSTQKTDDAILRADITPLST